MAYTLFHADCFDWLDEQPEASFEAIVTDPPYGLKEYSAKEQTKLRNGNHGGIWRIPPAIGGSVRSPLPRFTVMNQQELEELHTYFSLWGEKALRVIVLGAHLLLPPILFYLILLLLLLRMQDGNAVEKLYVWCRL